MSAVAIFWVLAGFAAGIAASIALLPVLRGLRNENGSQRSSLLVVGAAAVGLLVCAVGLYLTLGRPDAVDPAMASTVTAPHEGVSGSGGGMDSMEVSVQRLVDKLAANGGTDAEWDLLAQSYEFLGNAAAAAEARQHRVAGQPAAAPGSDVALYEEKVAASPKDAVSWLGLAELKRTQRDFAGAVAAYEKARDLKGMTADAWADYADALASQAGGSLGGPAAAAIEQALKMDKNHAKALWLKATLAVNERRYDDAARLWKQLRGVLPAGSPDITIIDANLAESEQLRSAGVPAPAAAAAKIAGTVEVDPGLMAKVTPGMTLFVYAKTEQAGGPPVAVFRQAVDRWPVRFVLDDTLAMMPARQLSNFDRVVVEARLSKTGQAIAASGDLQGKGVTVDTRSGQPVALRISQVIG
jgi:cytochrome c-type biogenesis protein CcmH